MVEYREIALGAVGSTNDECLKAAAEGDPGGLWLTAGEQTRGRGRAGKVWASVPGNLYASVLLVDPCELFFASQLSFVSALAVFAAAETVTGLSFPRITIKWPNDVLLDGDKFCGILLESARISRRNCDAVVIGFGVNIAGVPEGLPYGATALGRYRPGITARDVFTCLSGHFARTLELWNGGRFSQDGPPRRVPDFAVIRRQWLTYARGLGETVTLHMPNGDITGVFEGVDQYGRLELLSPEHGLFKINAGDLFFGPPAG
ncbi:MAG: biotin--[acetyl-CoA-carboxylase] ligase [Methylobacteriaceae bacterium]|nr:biotin--[acetyl-CoA-carboxylase] ligase [Methylobacteriaceae bacterium]